MGAMKVVKKNWELKQFKPSKKAPWKAAVLGVRKHLKARKREHPALFMIGAVGKHLYEAAKALYKEAGNKKWDLKSFQPKDSRAWKLAFASAQAELKSKKRQHPGLF